MDLEATIVARYQGEARLQRLLWIASYSLDHGKKCIQNDSQQNASNTTIEQALKLATQYAMEQGNLRRYKEAFHLLQAHHVVVGRGAAWISGAAAVTPDGQWMTLQQEQHRLAREALMQRLHVAKAHLNKEAIRVAYLALAEHDEKTGDLSEAFHSALRAKDYCTNRPQTVHVSLHILRISIYLQNYKTVQEFTTKLQHTIMNPTAGSSTATSGAAALATFVGGGASTSSSTASASSQDVVLRYKVAVASGLERLAAREYATAAQKFVEALTVASPDTSNNESGTSSSAPAEAVHWNAVLAPEDAALYAAFLSLAANDSRSQLVALAEHPEALELVPIAREAVLLAAKRANYQAAWSLLAEHIYPLFRVDLYMALHLEELQKRIRERFILQYWRAYQRVDLTVMQQQLGIGILPQPVEILTNFIQRRVLPPDTRVDLLTNTMIRIPSNPEQEELQKTQQKLQSLTNHVLDDTYGMIIRLACVEHDLVVVDPNVRNRRRGTAGRFPNYGSSSVVLLESDGDEEGDNDKFVGDEEDDHDDMPMVDAGAIAAIDEMNPEDLY